MIRHISVMLKKYFTAVTAHNNGINKVQTGGVQLGVSKNRDIDDNSDFYK